jgi:hypothetical protein
MKKVYSCKIIRINDIYNEVPLHVYYLLFDHTTRQDTRPTMPYTTYLIRLGRKEKFELWKITKIENRERKIVYTCNQAFLQSAIFAYIFTCNRKIRNFKCSCNTVLIYAKLDNEGR